MGHFMQKNDQVEKHGIIVANNDEILLRIAVEGRYKVNLFLGALTGSLQGVAERSLPCNYNVIQQDIDLSRR
jgi:hypothetical protein